MLSVPVHKDIGEYEPKIIGKMTARTLICVLGALGLSVIAGLYMYFVIGVNPGDYMMVIYALSLPFWACGFLRPHGMKFEQFAMYWLGGLARHQPGCDRLDQHTRHARRLPHRAGTG